MIPEEKRLLLDAQNWDEMNRRLYYFAAKRQSQTNLPHSWISPEDVVHEAIEKTYSGKRNWCDYRVTLLEHLMGAVRSIYSAKAKRHKRFTEWVKVHPGLGVAAFDVAESLAEYDFLQKFKAALRRYDSDLADFFDRANELLRENCETDSDIQTALDLPHGSVLRNRKKIERFRKQWQQEIEQSVVQNRKEKS